MTSEDHHFTNCVKSNNWTQYNFFIDWHVKYCSEVILTEVILIKMIGAAQTECINIHVTVN